jgi:hypothetical protein
MPRTIRPLSAAILDRLTGELVKHMHIRPSSPEALATVVETDRTFTRMMKSFYWEAGEGLGTSDRDAFKDMIAFRFAGEAWPRSDKEPLYFENTFIPRLHAGALDAGWEVLMKC